MRDLLTTAIFVYFLVQVAKKPYIGLLLMAWIGYMSPHRLGWGFAYNLPFYQVAVIVTLAATLYHGSRGKLRPTPLAPTTVVLIVFILWLGITTAFAEYQHLAWPAYIKLLKIQVGIFLTLILIDSREKLEKLVLVITVSIGFYGVKGGYFSIRTGGNFLVWGPPDSFIFGNNELALALLMILPFVYYLYIQAAKPWLKRVTLAAGMLILASAIFSYSRGAFLAMSVTVAFLWLQSNKKLPLALLLVGVIIVAIPFIPDAWYDRMNTIETYDEDASAMGRINAWHMALNVAKDRITGGGYEHWSYPMFAIYAPIATDVHDAHSIYFEVLGEHGFPGLALFLLLFFLAWRKASSIVTRTRYQPDLKWANTLAKMCKASLLAYATGGAFLGLAFFDLPYHIATIILVTSHLVTSHLATSHLATSHLVNRSTHKPKSHKPKPQKNN
jgi:putative inorganic carbon (HCO3(-)) transporter